MTAKPSAQAESGRKRREASRTEILAATRRLLARETSVADLSVDRIVSEAGVSRATFYVCFPDKVAVVAALAQESLAWRESVHAEVLADPKLTRERLDELMLTIVGHWQANRPVLAAIIELAEHDASLRGPWRAAVTEVAEQAAAQFRVRWEESAAAPDDPDTLASVFSWMLERSCHQLVVDDTSAKAVALAMSEILWRTLTYPPPRKSRAKG
ncbi:TetR/AcrR family transcriptional regulator [Sporichthya brevicatena]|uniref:TetR/AcrR family transcriptional regulator n=1 Tax=Sporichthya brevicatena TaxID=171442 RepID=A0ABN1GZ00_9ACTN